jgi:hypothetical protein
MDLKQMANRRRLKDQLRRAWLSTIERPYHDMLINSERGLQVYFCVELLKAFERDGVQRRLFIEPRIKLSSGERRFPDLVICNKRRVIGVVEIKYLPRAIPNCDKDFETLVRIGESNNGIVISNARYRGPRQPKKYSVADDAVLCWAAVHADEPFFCPDRSPVAPIEKRYLELRALTTRTNVKLVEL